MKDLVLWNMRHGYLDGVVRGLKTGFIRAEEYQKLFACESMDDFRAALEETEYGDIFAGVTELDRHVIASCIRQKLADEFRYIYCQSSEPLRSFLDYIARGCMIDNIISLIQATLNKRPIQETLDHLDPVGWMPELRTIAAMDLTADHEDLYRILLVDTPIGVYFNKYLTTMRSHGREVSPALQGSMTETDTELVKSLLKKHWLEDFANFCQSIGGPTSEIMGHILKTEADFRVLSVSLNAIVMGASAKNLEKNLLYPNFGYLYPEGTENIRKAWNESLLRRALDPYPDYAQAYDACRSFYKGEETAGSTNMRAWEDVGYAAMAAVLEKAFDQQFQFGVFYAWFRLREQEQRNLMWIGDMIHLRRREHIREIVPIFAPLGTSAHP